MVSAVEIEPIEDDEVDPEIAKYDHTDPREHLRAKQWAEELKNEGLTDPVEILKARILGVFDIDEELVMNLKVRPSLEIDVALIPTRRERMGYAWIPTAEDRKTKVPQWAREVQCPKCGAIMVPLNSKNNTKFGENITYQCHATDNYRVPCLTVVQVMDGVYHFMRPGDFSKSDCNWQDVAPGTIGMIPGTKVANAKPVEQFVKVPFIPPNPWTKGKTQSKVIWEQFWKTIVEEDECGYQELIEKVQAVRPQDARGKFYRKLIRDIDTIPSWMFRRTGFVIKQYGKVFRVIGRDKGDITRYPYSNAEYRKQAGMDFSGY